MFILKSVDGVGNSKSDDFSIKFVPGLELGGGDYDVGFHKISMSGSLQQ